MENNFDKLTTAMMLGEMVHGTEFDKVYTETFKSVYTEESKKDVDPTVAFQKANAMATRKSLTTLPLLFRLNYLCNRIDYSKKEFCTEELNIDWESINEILEENLKEFDYNANRRKVNNIQELIEYKVDVEVALDDIGAWIIKKCKDCKSDFSLQFGEVEYFILRKMNVPKRCYKCRQIRKGKNPEDIKNKDIVKNINEEIKKTEEELSKAIEESREERRQFATSAMTDALRRSGLFVDWKDSSDNIYGDLIDLN